LERENEDEELVPGVPDTSPADTMSGHVSHNTTSQTLDPGPVTPALAPLRDRHYHRIQLTQEQIKIVIDAIQRMKYPHRVHTESKPSMEEFENLESLRKTLLDAVE
jgi:hypothetical protein